MGIAANKIKIIHFIKSGPDGAKTIMTNCGFSVKPKECSTNKHDVNCMLCLDEIWKSGDEK